MTITAEFLTITGQPLGARWEATELPSEEHHQSDCVAVAQTQGKMPSFTHEDRRIGMFPWGFFLLFLARPQLWPWDEITPATMQLTKMLYMCNIILCYIYIILYYFFYFIVYHILIYSLSILCYIILYYVILYFIYIYIYISLDWCCFTCEKDYNCSWWLIRPHTPRLSQTWLAGKSPSVIAYFPTRSSSYTRWCPRPR